MPKSSFVLYLDYKKHFDLIQDDTDFRRLIEAIFAYCETGTEPSDLSPVALMAFSFIRANLDRDSDKYEAVKEKRKEAGRLGGLAKASNAKQMVAKASNAKQSLANVADTVTVTGTVDCNNTPLTPQQGYKPETVTLFTLCDSSASPSGCDFSHAEEKPTNGGKKKGFSDDFNRFWEKYPRKVSKGQAWKTWQKLQKDGTLPDVDTLIEAVRWRQLEPDWEKDGGKYIPHASTWLNACGWEDEGCKAPEQIPNDPREERAVEICKNHGIDYYFCACPCTQEAAVDKYKRLIAATRELRAEGLELYEPFRENFRGHLRRYGVLEQVEEELGWTEGA